MAAIGTMNSDSCTRMLHGGNTIRGPQRIADTLSKLMARRGYAQMESAGERDEAWQTAVGSPDLSAYSSWQHSPRLIRSDCE